MKSILTILCLLLATLGASAQSSSFTPNDNAFNHVSYRSLPPLRVNGKEGVSAPFAGTIGHSVFVAGGCNFAEKPAAQGGKKQFYSDIFEITPNHSEKKCWEKIGSIPHALAYGASVSVPHGIVCIGGTDGQASSSQVLLIHSNANHHVQTDPLPSLPVGLDNLTAAYGNGYIYAAGGQSNGTGVCHAYRLRYPHGEAWERLPDFPGAARLQPASAVQNSNTGACFYLMGGYAPASSTEEATVHTDGWAYHPQSKSWQHVSPIVPYGQKSPMALVGAQGIASGCAHIVFVGGVNLERFEEALNRPLYIQQTRSSLARTQSQALHSRLSQLQHEDATYLLHPAPWYRFNSQLLIYHTITDTWVTESHSPLLARAGAALVAVGNEWILIDGESKPGIRSADVTSIKMVMRPSFGWLNWFVLIAYLAGMVALGYYFMRREGDADDFFKGGGRIPWWAAGISIYATMLSAITYMAYPAKAYATDWTYYPMLVTILIVSFPVIKYYLPFFRRLNVTSAYEYLERRFNAATRIMASALFIVFMVARMALVLYLPSLALTAVTGIDLYICIVLMAIVTIVYCTMGGVEAVVWGDVIQGFILVGGALFAVAYLIWGTEGGLEGFLQIGMDNHKFRLFDWSFDYRSATFWVILLGGLANNLISYTSDQTVIQRYLTTKDEDGARRSILLNGVMSVFISIAFFAIGAGLFTFFKTHPAELDFTMAKADTIFPFFMMSQLPQGLAGLLIAAIFAATMSTISSNINSVATAFSMDFYKRWKPEASDRNTLLVARRTCVIAGLLGMGIALLMATWEILSLLDFFQEILGLLSSGLGGLFLMGIFFPRIGGKAALIGFICGVTTVFLTRYFTDASFLLYGAIGMGVSVLTGWICSFFIKEKKNLQGLCWKTIRQ